MFTISAIFTHCKTHYNTHNNPLSSFFTSKSDIAFDFNSVTVCFLSEYLNSYSVGVCFSDFFFKFQCASYFPSYPSCHA